MISIIFSLIVSFPVLGEQNIRKGSEIDQIYRDYIIDQYYRSKLSEQTGCPIEPGYYRNINCA